MSNSDGPGVVEPMSVTAKAAAEALGVKPISIYRALDRGELEEVRLGGRRLVSYRSLLALLPKEAS